MCADRLTKSACQRNGGVDDVLLGLNLVLKDAVEDVDEVAAGRFPLDFKEQLLNLPDV